MRAPNATELFTNSVGVRKHICTCVDERICADERIQICTDADDKHPNASAIGKLEVFRIFIFALVPNLHIRTLCRVV